jgi:hypothetical protein
MNLEDHLGDIIRKARDLSNVSAAAAAGAAGSKSISPPSLKPLASIPKSSKALPKAGCPCQKI